MLADSRATATYLASMPQCTLGAIHWPSSGNERSPQENSLAVWQYGQTKRMARQSLFAGHIKHISALDFRQVRLASSGLHAEHSWNTFRRFSAHIIQRGICNKVLFGQYVYCFLALSIIRKRIYYTFVF